MLKEAFISHLFHFTLDARTHLKFPNEASITDLANCDRLTNESCTDVPEIAVSSAVRRETVSKMARTSINVVSSNDVIVPWS